MRIEDFSIKIGDITFHGDQITEWNGFQIVTVEHELVKNALGNGTIVTGSYMPQREMDITVRIDRNKADKTLRYFTANKEHVLQIGRRKANILVESAEIKWSHRLYNDPFLHLEMIAPDPFFYDVSNFGRNLANIVPKFSFPWTYSLDKPISFGYREFTDRTVFTNDGDEKVGVKFRIEALDTVQNVKLENLRTGEYMIVNQTLQQGDILEVSTVGGDSYILLNGEDIFDQIDRLSNFFKLEVGDNFLQYSAQLGTSEMDVYLYYRPKYLTGVEDITL